MKNLGSALLSLLGSAAAPGFAFLGRVTTGLFGRPDGGLGFSVLGTEVARYEGDGRRVSRELEYAKGFGAITGGGIVSYANGCVKWSNRFIMIPVATALETARYIEIIMPASGASIAVDGAASRTVTADGIPIQSWETLFAIHTNGGGIQFYLGTYNSGTVIKDNYIPICTQNADLAFVRFCVGMDLYSGESHLNRAGWKRVSGTSWALKYDDASTAVIFSAANEARSVTAGYRMDYKVQNADADNKNWRWSFSSTSIALECVNDAYSTSSTAMNFTRDGTVVVRVAMSGTLYNISDGAYDLGGTANRWKNLYLVNQPTVSSDMTGKENVRDLTSAEMKAWADVTPKIYNLTGASMLSAGYVAQDVITAFSKQKLDPKAYNLLDMDAGTGKYSLRYGECAMFEAAYQRSRATQNEVALAKVTASLNTVLRLLNLGTV